MKNTEQQISWEASEGFVVVRDAAHMAELINAAAPEQDPYAELFAMFGPDAPSNQPIPEATAKEAQPAKKCCPRCNGTGVKRWNNQFGQQSGDCFRCSGTGEWRPSASWSAIKAARKYGSIEGAILARDEERFGE